MLDPRQRAAEFLATLPTGVWDGRTLPVPVERIADTHCRLLVRDVSARELRTVQGAPQDDAISGLLLVDDGEIWINAEEESPGRRRFTIGHELGHWELHRPTGRLFCRASSVTAEKGAPDLEEQASLFGSGLLFPPHLVAAHHARLDGDLDALCGLFGASRTAMQRAVCFAVRRPLQARFPGVRMFHLEDPAYDEWRAAHREDGYVLNDDLGNGSGAKLHRARCHYLNRALREGQPARTQQPKWCATDAAALRAILPRAGSCSQCRP